MSASVPNAIFVHVDENFQISYLSILEPTLVIREPHFRMGKGEKIA